MASLIPQNFIDDLLDRSDIVDIIDKRIKLKRTGHNYVGLCPFHEEKSPSFSVNPDKQFYYCFGCGAGGNALGFVMEYERLEFPQAVEILAANLGLDIPKEVSAFDDKSESRQKIHALLDKAADFYYHQLKHHSAANTAVEYLKNRGLTGQVAKQFKIGFAPPGWDNLIQGLEKEADKQLLIDAGLVVDKPEEKKCYDRFRNRITFPIRDKRGKVIAFGGRVLGDDKPKYLNSPETLVFHKGRELYGLYEARQANRELHRVVVVEGYMDVVALAQHGINYAVATLGTATSEEHLKRLFRLTPAIIFCFDGDKAGRAAADRALHTCLPLMEDGKQIKFLFLPEGEDPDSLVRQIGSAGFVKLLDEAMPLSEYLFNSISKDIDPNTMDGRARLSSLAMPMINQIPKGVFQQLLLQGLAERTGLDISDIRTIADTDAPTATIRPEPVPALLDEPPPPSPEDFHFADHEEDGFYDYQEDHSTPTTDFEPQNVAAPAFRLDLNKLNKLPPIQAAITMLLHRPELADKLQPSSIDQLKSINEPNVHLLVNILELIKEQESRSIGTLLGHWYGTEEGKLLTELAALERLIPHDGLEEEFFDTINAVSALSQKDKLTELLQKAKRLSFDQLSDDEKAKLKKLLADRESG